ncbi:hypothetical protein PFLG_02351 [Plasmodium falciparum RAJ116]|uniref:Uncharacterized protein n=1 Tax=Plasmodium falciparum RAJ116 TaxID=580058 RepID=A0A0L0CS81_PLAFA|nr:hypothetical protein PFLG_00104 [Plasmodium falciparum RAJ116]KNC37041.1 hypothetical protein PFLG_02351 [Plasmodium falciparum RAJ116]
MDQKFYEKSTKIDIPPPMKIMENGTPFFHIVVDDGLYDGTLEVDVPYFVHVVENGRLLVENQGQNLDDQKMYLWQLSEKMDQKFYQKLRKIDIPPPMKIVENGTFFIDHGLCDGVNRNYVPYFVDVVENGDVLVENQGQNLGDQKILIIGISST